MNEILSSIRNMFGSGTMPEELANTYLGTKTFSPISGEAIATRMKIVQALAELPDDQLDTVFVGTLVKGKSFYCESCEETHDAVNLSIMGIGNPVDIEAMLISSAGRISNGEGQLDSHEKFDATELRNPVEAASKN